MAARSRCAALALLLAVPFVAAPSAEAGPPAWAPAHGYRAERDRAPRDAGPPPWAPAHGWRAKHGLPPATGVPPGRDTAAHARASDPWLVDGGCDRMRLGEVLAEAARDAVGDGSLAGELAAAAVGILVEDAIGRRMDPLDQACLAGSLAKAEDGAPVVWHNPDAGTAWRVEPLASGPGPLGRPCRVVRVAMQGGDGVAAEDTLTLCRDPQGRWRPL